MSKIIAISNQKGGVGKTTTCINLCAYLAALGKRVLLVDIDPQGNSTSGLGLDKRALENTIYNVLLGDINARDAIRGTTVPGLHIIPSNVDLAGGEVELINNARRDSALRAALSPLRNDYDFILIDCPPSLGLMTVNALACADSVLIPIQGEYFALEGLSQLMNTIKLVKKIGLNPSLEIEGVVLTMYDSRSNLVSNVADEILAYFGKKVFNTRIPRNIRLAEAPSFGLPVMQFEPRSNGSLAYKALAEELLARNNITYAPITNLSALRVRRK